MSGPQGGLVQDDVPTPKVCGVPCPDPVICGRAPGHEGPHIGQDLAWAQVVPAQVGALAEEAIEWIKKVLERGTPAGDQVYVGQELVDRYQALVDKA